jgi:DNA-binding MarR family transcriptional regulator
MSTRRLSKYMRQQGAAVIGARLRRLSERIDSDAARLYKEAGLEFEQRWYGVVHLLAETDLSVTELAKALGIRHASVSQTRSSLENAGLVESKVDAEDARRTILCLTSQGRKFVAKISAISAALVEVGVELDREAAGVVAALGRLDRALDRKSLFVRARERL